MDILGWVLTVIGILGGGIVGMLIAGFIIEYWDQIAQFFRYRLTKDGRRRRLAARTQKLHARAMADLKNQRKLVKRNRVEAEVDWLNRFLEAHGVVHQHTVPSSLSNNELDYVRSAYRQAYRDIIDPPKPTKDKGTDWDARKRQRDHEIMIARSFGLDQDKSSVTITGRVV